MKKKALLVVSFGTSFIDSRKASLDKILELITDEFTDFDIFEAYTSKVIINKYKKRDNITILNVGEAIEKIYRAGYKEVVVATTLIINGAEYYKMNDFINPYREKFEKISIGRPLLTETGDYLEVAKALGREISATDDKTAVVFMGHGTHHHANSAYPMLDYIFKHNGFPNYFMGTVEGCPSLKNISEYLKKQTYEKILLYPFMTVAGDHAHNDMAGEEEDSWLEMFKAQGYRVEANLVGLGEMESIQEIFIEHTKDAIKSL